jgi:hypothetical protein
VALPVAAAFASHGRMSFADARCWALLVASGALLFACGGEHAGTSGGVGASASGGGTGAAACPMTDQRGQPRKTACTLGAVEAG